MIMECKVTARKSHYPKDVPFEVPEGWVWCQLKDICSFLSRGKSPVYSNTIREYPVFAQKCNLKEGGISLDKALFLDPITLPRWPEQYKLQNEDILVNSTGTGTVGRTRLFSSNCLGNYPFVVPDSHVSVIRTWENISSKYVLAVLSSEYGQHYIEDNLAGSTNQKELYIGVLEDFPIPIAPSNEQQYIAEKIDSLFDAIFQIDRTKENLEVDISAAKSRILDLAIHGKLVPQDNSEEPAIELLRHINPDFQPSHNLHYGERLPNGWTCGLFGDLNQHRNKSEDPLASPNEEYELYSVPIYETGMPEFLHGKEIGSTKQIVDKGDVLLCKINPHLNRSWVVSHYRPELKCIASSEWLIFANEAVLPDFARLFFISPQFKELMLSNVSGVGGSLMRARASAVNNYPIWIPPINEQKRIVKAVYQLYDTVDSLASNLD